MRNDNSKNAVNTHAHQMRARGSSEHPGTEARPRMYDVMSRDHLVTSHASHDVNHAPARIYHERNGFGVRPSVCDGDTYTKMAGAPQHEARPPCEQ